jgi:lipoprotein-anchoring transpeptidase ErfK/SrfK
MNGLKKTAMAASCLVLSVVPMAAQTRTTNRNVGPAEVARVVSVSDTRPTRATVRPTAAPATRLIVVSLRDRRLALVEEGVVKKVYRVAVGREDSPSPTGTFTIVDRVENPTYYHTGEVIPPGPQNPVGTRWMGLNRKGYGIHGTNEPRSVGRAVSHGCIRMRQGDLEELFAQVRSGDEVEIIGERDAETAAIFGGAAPERTNPASMVTGQVAPETPGPAGASAVSDAAENPMVTAVVPANR